jgi:RNase P subunit RPR2
MTFTIIDDGTLDTVVSCDDCGEQQRFNSDELPECDLNGAHVTCYDDRIEQALEWAGDMHEDCEGS